MVGNPLPPWHGWSVDGWPALHVGTLPARKNLALYLDHGAEIEVLAYFKDAEAAVTMLNYLDRLIEGTQRQFVGQPASKGGPDGS